MLSLGVRFLYCFTNEARFYAIVNCVTSELPAFLMKNGNDARLRSALLGRHIVIFQDLVREVLGRLNKYLYEFGVKLRAGAAL
jgi:hypothetical protein